MEVGGLSGSFLVRGKPLMDRVPGFPFGAVALGLVLAAVLLWVIGWRGPDLLRGRTQGVY